MKRALPFALLILVTPAWAGEITGRAAVIDGDTVDIHGQRVRINGVDAPESRQICKDARGADYRCGQAAALALDDYLSASRPTKCIEVDRDRYGRTVADCYRADGASVAAWMVRQGHALDWPRYSKGRYAGEQRTAQQERRRHVAGRIRGAVGVAQGRPMMFALVGPLRASRSRGLPGTINRPRLSSQAVCYHPLSREAEGPRYPCESLRRTADSF